jgi:hypothetical protein
LEKDTGTGSETVSESIARAVKNSGELKQIILDFTGDFAIFLTLNHAFQVAARLFTGNHRRRLQEGRRKPPKHPSQVENRHRKPAGVFVLAAKQNHVECAGRAGAATALFRGACFPRRCTPSQSGVALRLPPQSKASSFRPLRPPLGHHPPQRAGEQRRGADHDVQRRYVRRLVPPNGRRAEDDLQREQREPEPRQPGQPVRTAQFFPGQESHCGHAEEDGVGDEAVSHLQIHLKRGDGIGVVDFDAVGVVAGDGFGGGGRPDFSIRQRKIRNRQPGVLMPHGRGDEQLNEN